MSFSSLLEKMANGESLSPGEKQDLMLEARRLEEVSSLVTSIIQPGTKILEVDGLVANNAEVNTAKIRDAEIESATTGDGDVVMDDFGIYIKNAVQAALAFEATTGNRLDIFIWSDTADNMAFNNNLAGKGFVWNVTTSGALAPYMELKEDTGLADSIKLGLIGEKGSLLDLGQGAAQLRATGDAEPGYTFLLMQETPLTPPDPGSLDSFHAYIKNDKFIIQFNDGGTVRYKYLDLTGTGVTWVHTTSAP